MKVISINHFIGDESCLTKVSGAWLVNSSLRDKLNVQYITYKIIFFRNSRLKDNQYIVNNVFQSVMLSLYLKDKGQSFAVLGLPAFSGGITQIIEDYPHRENLILSDLDVVWEIYLSYIFF